MPSPSVTEFSIPTANSTPFAITAGADGNIWFTETGGNKIGRISLAGAITEFSAPGAPGGITAGPDGALWFTEIGGNKIGRMTTAGVITNEFAIRRPAPLFMRSRPGRTAHCGLPRRAPTRSGASRPAAW